MDNDRFFERTLSRRLIHTGHVITLRVDEVELPNGKTTIREVVQHPGAVAIVACPSVDTVLLVRQYRYPIDSISLELPAGKLDAGEEPDLAARRELEEETGYAAVDCRRIMMFYSTPGFSDERMYLYKATGLQSGPQRLDEDEFLSCHTYTRHDISDMLERGAIIDAKTWVGLLWWLRQA